MPEHILDTSADSVTQNVVAAVADATDRDLAALPPLYDAVDPDALEVIVNRPPRVGRDSAGVEVTFGYADCVVTVSSADGVVSVETVTDSVAPRLTVDD